MLSSLALKKIVTEARPIIERQLGSYRALNSIFMAAWRGGYLDELWAESRRDDHRCWLTYFIRVRGMGDIKIGKSNQVRVRLRSLFTAASRGLDLVACYPAPIEHEKELHAEFERLRLCGEWFRPGAELLTHLRLVGCNVDAFTNAVPAHFYRQFPERMQ
jgi:hypothetical protein